MQPEFVFNNDFLTIIAFSQWLAKLRLKSTKLSLHVVHRVRRRMAQSRRLRSETSVQLCPTKPNQALLYLWLDDGRHAFQVNMFPSCGGLVHCGSPFGRGWVKVCDW